MQNEPTPAYTPACQAKTLRGTQGASLSFAICQTKEDNRRLCKFAHDLGFNIVVCRHPRHAEIVSRTATTDNTANG